MMRTGTYYDVKNTCNGVTCIVTWRGYQPKIEYPGVIFVPDGMEAEEV
jgi:hypothetical protein